MSHLVQDTCELSLESRPLNQISCQSAVHQKHTSSSAASADLTFASSQTGSDLRDVRSREVFWSPGELHQVSDEKAPLKRRSFSAASPPRCWQEADW